MLKKIARGFFYLLFLFLAVLSLSELTFRYYLVDFYGANLQTLNSPHQLKDKPEGTILVLGDSFSADQQSYVNGLRASFPQVRIVNASIPGTCARQHALQLPTRIQQFSPNLFIYQLYLGNDLLEWRHPLTSSRISMMRKCYWWLADRFLILAFINAKLPQLRQTLYHDLPTHIDPKILEAFAPERYSARSKMQFRAEPNLIENTVLMQGQRKADAMALTQSIQAMIQQLPTQCQVLILPIPHCMQLGAPYLERLQQIGAQIHSPSALIKNDYPFLQYLKSQFNSKRIQILNPLPMLREQDVLQAVYYPNDPHLNRLGHEIIQRQIEDSLSKRNIFGAASH